MTEECPHCGKEPKGIRAEPDGRVFYDHGDGKYCVLYPKGWNW